MKKILVINPKGGCGKTTIVTNLASYYALWEVPVAVVDYDEQQSSLDWIAIRDANKLQTEVIHGINGLSTEVNVGSDIKRVLMDAPAACSMEQAVSLMKLADVVLIPVLPSAIDFRAADRFINELTQSGLFKNVRIGLIGNRVRQNTLVFSDMKSFLRKKEFPVVTNLRDTQSYIRAAEGGIGIFEMPPFSVKKDMKQWRKLINWVEGGKNPANKSSLRMMKKPGKSENKKWFGIPF